MNYKPTLRVGISTRALNTSFLLEKTPYQNPNQQSFFFTKPHNKTLDATPPIHIHECQTYNDMLQQLLPSPYNDIYLWPHLVLLSFIPWNTLINTPMDHADYNIIDCIHMGIFPSAWQTLHDPFLQQAQATESYTTDIKTNILQAWKLVQIGAMNRAMGLAAVVTATLSTYQHQNLELSLLLPDMNLFIRLNIFSA
jgi:hypothetical protein